MEQPPQAERPAHVQQHQIDAVWREFKRYEEKHDKIDRALERIDGEIDHIQGEQREIKETLKHMTDSVGSILDDSKWLRRTVTNILIGGTFSAILGGIVFLVQKGVGG